MYRYFKVVMEVTKFSTSKYALGAMLGAMYSKIYFKVLVLFFLQFLKNKTIQKREKKLRTVRTCQVLAL